MISDEEALKRFDLRKRLFAIIPRIENSLLVAGSPMYFYCRCCGDMCDELPEDFLTVPKLTCVECDGLIDRGLLPTVLR